MDEKKYRVLVVDDETDLCDILKFNLEAEGYHVTTANSAEEALEKNVARYDLLLLDVMMGGMDGFSLARMLKKRAETSQIPIIFLTARTTESDTVNGLDIGADDYIAKPFSVREVLARVRSVLRRTAEAQAEQETVAFEGLGMDLRRTGRIV